jgi:hypothetical protein
MAYSGVSEEVVRNLNIDKIIKGISVRTNHMKPLLNIVNTDGEKNRYYRETLGTLNATRDLARGAEFPSSNLTWEEQNVWIEKYGHQQHIHLEDVMFGNIDVIQRIMLRLAADVNRQVDERIYTRLTDTAQYSRGAAATWDNGTRSARIPHEDIARAIADLETNDNGIFPPSHILVNPGDFAYLKSNDFVLDSFDASNPSVMSNGVVGKLMGLNVIVSSSVDADEAMVVAQKTVGNWFTNGGLRTSKEEVPGIKWTLKAWEFGVVGIVQPYAAAKITNTRT